MSFPLHTPPIVMEAKHHDAGGKKASVVAAAMRGLGPKGRNGGAESSGKAAVAVDGDKSSQHAHKWAADHLLARAQSFYLLHVHCKNSSLHPAVGKQFSTSHLQEDIAASLLAQMDLQTKELLLPFQCFCSRRGVHNWKDQHAVCHDETIKYLAASPDWSRENKLEGERQLVQSFLSL